MTRRHVPIFAAAVLAAAIAAMAAEITMTHHIATRITVQPGR